MNMIKTFILMGALTFLLMALGGAIGGQMGIVIALVFSIVMNGFSYWFSDSIVLKMYRAKEVDADTAPDLYWTVHELAEAAQLPMPKVYIIDNPTPNAFATGRNPKHAAVAVNSGLMRLLDKRELRGVIAHELSHVRHYDILIGSVAGTVAGAISSIAFMGRWALIFGGFGRDDDGEGLGALLLIILAPILAMILQMSISRRREYAADLGAAKLTKDPGALASGLRKLAYGNEVMPMHSGPATAHMFIVNPLSGKSLMNLFSTHPPVEERIRRLEDMEHNGIPA